ncbi:hypothetical protein Aph01nite_34840 [Acrocarpospora phusangensis]|uniref:Uncharacterized protein n=1 Tax=Acrocarpospora phusangensis TaxID=1070424 RepID=A0A919UKM6_9ACTN|nr:hypothetical protein [Acrocarpospora phusangensis]GIH25174.1 hypothetical protein Aph01nite_34840 [Acrocarpospora phusangensis]
MGVLNVQGAPEPKPTPEKKQRKPKKTTSALSLRLARFPDDHDDDGIPIFHREEVEAIDSDSSEESPPAIFRSRKQPLPIVRGKTPPQKIPAKPQARPTPRQQIVIPDSPPRTTSRSTRIVIPESPPRNTGIFIPDSPPRDDARNTGRGSGIVIPESPPRDDVFGGPFMVPDSQPDENYGDYAFSDEEMVQSFDQDEPKDRETDFLPRETEVVIRDDDEFVLEEKDPVVTADILSDDPTPVIAAPTPEPKIPPRFAALKGRMSYRNLTALAQFVSDNPDLVAELLRTLDSPDAPAGPVARYWLSKVREVVPDSTDTLAMLGPHAYQADPFWAVVGKALNVRATGAFDVLGEYSWASRNNPAALDPFLKSTDRGAVRQRIALLTQNQALPNKGPTLDLASMDEDKSLPEWNSTRQAAQGWLKERIEARQRELLAEHGSYKDWMKKLGEDDSLSYARSLDRLADVLTTYWPDRVVVAVLHKEREIGICANLPDKGMWKDLEALLAASRLRGPAAEQAEQSLLRHMAERLKRTDQRPIKSSHERTKIRLRKTLAFLRDLEEKHGRIRVVAYDDDLPKRYGTPQQIHAEMQALAVALARQKGANLGVSKLCCIKCWLILNDVYPTVFDRRFATHMTTYPWPTSDLLQDVDTLRTLFTGPPPVPQQVVNALDSERGRTALVRAIFNVKAKSPAPDTGYASSQESQPSLPPALLEPDLPADDEPKAFQDYLDSDAALTPEEEAARWGDHPRPLAPKTPGPKIVDGRFVKAKGTTTNLPDQGSISMTGIPQITVPKTPKIQPAKPTKTVAQKTPVRTGRTEQREETDRKRKRSSGSGSPAAKRSK